MAPLRSAEISFAPLKSCFLLVSGNWIKQKLLIQDIPVFKIEYNGKKAFFSSKVETSLNESEVQLNTKYGQSLGFKDKELVLVHQVEEQLSQAEKVYLEPLSSDDWQILHLNSENIENNLLNQIRVVWKDQVFPVWARQISFFVKVASVEPDDEPVLIGEGTEVHVIPKERSIDTEDSLEEVKQKKIKEMLSRYKNLRKHRKSDESYSSMSSSDSNNSKQENHSLSPVIHQNETFASTFLNFVMKRVFLNGYYEPHASDNKSDYEFVPLNLDFRLRVISYSSLVTDNLPLALQTTTVFISDNTFKAHCDMSPIPDCFVAKLSKLISPLELKEKLQNVHSQNPKDKKKKTDKLPESEEKSTVLDSLYVNVIVLKSMKDEQFKAPVSLFLNSNIIAVPLEIKRRLGLEVTSCVECQSVEKKNVSFNRIVLKPLEILHSNFEEHLAAKAFSQWVEDANLENSSLVLSDGTLVKLTVSPGRSCDFIIFLADDVDSKTPSPQTSLNGASSSNGVESEKNSIILPNVLNYGFLNNTHLSSVNIKLGCHSPQLHKHIWCHSNTSNKIDSLYQHLPSLGLEALGGVQDIAKKAMIDLELWFHLSPLTIELSGYSQNHGCMLIYGPTGVGKSTLLKALCKKLIGHPYYVYVGIIECLPLRGKRIETIAKKWDAVLAEAAYRQPSLIIFEDLDKLASAAATPEQEALPDAIYFSSVAQTFISFIEKIVDNKAEIVVAATSKSLHSLHPLLTSARGRHVFQSIIEIKPPNVKARDEILQCLVLSKVHISADLLTVNEWQDLATKTEGYVAQDLDSLVDRATHAAFVRTNYATQCQEGKELMLLNYGDFETALENYTPSALRGLQLLHGSTKTWKDIGGLKNVKTVIEQILSWPVKYKELFKDFKLRPQTNILLYGAPGTGKTLIAGVIANECGLNFISIKGPELLSKFIGASEQAVRDLFTRASGAKPCILFFDEFDALAPRRGHDNTGVTDRVVNQLLTQIDGVENLEGVYVLAATSRPELIDPALLRPGRFDKCLLCPLPNSEERLEILNALSSKLNLSYDVDFNAVVSKTENFSGADLQALLYSAQIEALHENQSNKSRRCSVSDDDGFDFPMGDFFLHMPSLEKGADNTSNEELSDVMFELNTLISNLRVKNEKGTISKSRRHSTICLTIEQRHILKVLDATKPSVSPQERFRYERIFQKFRSSSGSEFSSANKNDTKRMTLA